ncbi:MAG: glycosyltransferase [Desulfobacteraceae bacterium]|nr:glycosyltransferase [Desulfobacteraceae bacterium]
MPSNERSIPSVSRVHSVFNNEHVSLLERLRRWPFLEPDCTQRRAGLDQWRQQVSQRRADGAPRRVLFVHGQLPGETGSGVYLQQIAAEAIRRGIDLYLLSAGYHPLNSKDIPNVPVERIFTCLFTPPGQVPLPGAVKTPISGMSVVMPYPVLAFRDRTDEELLDWLMVFGRHIETLVAQLQPDVIHVDHLWFLNGLARLVAPWIPLVASCHGTAFKLILDAPRFGELVAPCVASADHVCAISPQTLRECIETFGVPEDCITIEGYGFEPELFHYRSVDRGAALKNAFDVDLQIDGLLAVAVGKFVDWKGFKELALAIGHLRQKGVPITGIIVGEGDRESRSDLEYFIHQHGLADYLLLPGKVERSLLPDIYRAADIYILPSHVEPYGMVLMEALACGSPAVCAMAGGPPSFVPAALREESLVIMVDAVQMTADGHAVAEDRTPYALRLAQGMEAVLFKKILPLQRQRIAEAMLPLSWGRLVDNLGVIYDRLITKALSAEHLSP